MGRQRVERFEQPGEGGKPPVAMKLAGVEEREVPADADHWDGYASWWEGGRLYVAEDPGPGDAPRRGRR